MVITISYDPITRSIGIKENDFTAIEAFGVLEAARMMIANHWLFNTEAERGEDDGKAPGETH